MTNRMNEPRKPDSNIRNGGKLTRPKTIIGWRERVDLPMLGLFGLIAKIDTGARTSSLHIDHIEPFDTDNGQTWARVFKKVKSPDGGTLTKTWELQTSDVRVIRSSNGHTEERCIIKTNLVIGDISKVVEFTLTNRNLMRHQILIGRTALMRDFLVDSGKSFLID